ncbi:MAG: hypothetical protein Q7R70_02310 [Candidatus Diapherotrites archaeon]|nr:hypothetical protein [Candidatus Diapherotrites archaeon]
MSPSLKRIQLTIRHPRKALALNVLKNARKKSSASMYNSRAAASLSRMTHRSAKGYVEIAADFKKRGSDPSFVESIILEQAQKSINYAKESQKHLSDALAIRAAARKKANWIAGKNRKKPH